MPDSPASAARVRILAILVAILFIVLAARLWQLQIMDGAQYARQSYENRLRIELIPAPRGIIYDRNGIPLVQNIPYYFVSIQQDMLRDVDLPRVADFFSMDVQDLHDKIRRHKTLEPVHIVSGLGPEDIAFVEARLSDLPGLVIDVQEARNYTMGDVASHLIGYLGKPSPAQLASKTYETLPPQTFIGQAGVERMFDDVLRGEPGQRAIEVDAFGRTLRLLKETPPRRGQDLVLSIDLDMQRAAEAAFEDRTGALVAINPTTGEVLALVSRPSFDPNLFATGISAGNWRQLTEDPRHPLYNRALQSHYPPGSTFKIFTALAGLSEGDLTASSRYSCGGSLSKGPWTFRCWNRKGHGGVDLHRSLVESCDVFYYNAGERIGIDNIARYARMFGLGEPPGLGLSMEAKGLIPDTHWKKDVKKQDWYLGETFNAAIGQGYVLASPVQMARAMAAVANGGLLPELTMLRIDGPPPPMKKLPIAEGDLQLVKDALLGVVNEPGGTGHAAALKQFKVGGKTGTAQVASQPAGKRESDLPDHLKDHAWFVAFAPDKDPQVALAVIVEHGGHGGSAAAPVAKKALEAFFRLNKDAPPQEEQKEKSRQEAPIGD